MKPIGFANFFLTGNLSGDFASLPKVTGNKKGRLKEKPGFYQNLRFINPEFIII